MDPERKQFEKKLKKRPLLSIIATLEPLFLKPFGEQNPTPNSVSPRLLQKHTHTQSGQRSHTYRFVVDFGPIWGPNFEPFLYLGTEMAPRACPRAPRVPQTELFDDFGSTLGSILGPFGSTNMLSGTVAGRPQASG